MEAMRLPPFTIERRRGPVFSLRAVFPFEMSSCIVATSTFVTSRASMRPISGLTWFLKSPRSVSQLDCFFSGFSAGPSSR